MKKYYLYLCLILDLILIVSFVLINFINLFVLKVRLNFALILGIVFAVFVMVLLIICLEKYRRDKQSETGASGRLYFKRREFRGRIWRFSLKIEVGAEMLEFFLPANLYASVNEGDQVIFEYMTGFGGTRWITRIEAYK